MRFEVLLPKWGMTMQEGTITEWLVAVGTHVTEGEPLAMVETEKVEAELLAPEDGTLVEIVTEPGSTIDIGTVVAWLER